MELSHTDSGSKVVFLLKGKFTFSDHEKFRYALNAIKKDETKVVVFDMGGVEFIDSAALGMLLIAREESEKHNVDLSIQNVKGQLQKMFQLSQFNDIFKMS